MTASSTQLLVSDKFGSTFADPTDPNFTVRFKTTKTRKSLAGKSTDNYVTEIIVNDLDDVTIGDSVAPDAISVRIRTSTSELSMGRLKAILSSVASQLPTWTTENVLLGFRPTTVPVNPQE